MLDQRAAAGGGQRAGDHPRVTLDHHVEIVTGAIAPQPGVPHETPDRVRAPPMIGRQTADGGEQGPAVGIEGTLQAGAHREGRRGRRPPDDAHRRAAPQYDHRGRASGEVATHDDLGFACAHRRQRSSQPADWQGADAERLGARSVLAQHPPTSARRQHLGATPPGQPGRVARGQRRGAGHDRTVHEVGGHRHHLRIGMGTPGHQEALGWNCRYIRFSAELGRCV